METIKKAMQLMDDGLLDDAMETLEGHLQIASDDEKFMIVELYYDWGFFEKAVTILQQLLQDYPGEGELLAKLAEMYIELEKDEEAINLLNDINKADSFYLQSLLHLADLYESQGLFEVAEQKLLEAKELAPDENVIDFALGELLFSIGQYSRAIPFYEKLLAETEELMNVSIIERLAEGNAMIGYYEQALHYYEQLNSENPDTLFKFGFTAYQINRNDIAINVWKQLLERDPHYHTVYSELARALREEGQLKEAYKVAKDGLSYDEYNKELYLIIGHIALSLNNRTESKEFVEKAIELDVDYKEAILLFIQLLKDENNYEEIITFLNKVKEDGGYDSAYDWELAKAYKEIESFKEALHSYQEAMIHLSHDSEFLKEYGYYLTEEGLVEDAINVFSNYLELEPMDEETLSFVERLKYSTNG